MKIYIFLLNICAYKLFQSVLKKIISLFEPYLSYEFSLIWLERQVFLPSRFRECLHCDHLFKAVLGAGPLLCLSRMDSQGKYVGMFLRSYYTSHGLTMGMISLVNLQWKIRVFGDTLRCQIIFYIGPHVN